MSLGARIVEAIIAELREKLGDRLEDALSTTPEEAPEVKRSIGDTSLTKLKNVTIKEKLGPLESGSRYNIKNKYGMLGKYQLSKEALQDLAYLGGIGNWLGKDGINSEIDFLTDATIQEKAMDEWLNLLNKRLERAGLFNYIGKEKDGVKITHEGLISAAHFAGINGLREWLRGDRDITDANNTTPLRYIKLFV
jgi:hypothetical protein